MRLKILVVPFLLVMIVILSIGYIKPDFDTILAKKAEIVAQDELQAKADKVVSNVDVLNTALNQNQESEKFVLQYLPVALDQDQIVDAFNYLASQHGIIVTDMNMAKSSDPVVAPQTAPDGTLVETAQQASTFVFTGGVYGSYENIKAFFNRLTHIGRYQSIQLFSLQKDESNQNKSSDLKGTFVVDYGFLPLKNGVSALSKPIFQNSTLSFTDVADLKAKTTELPVLEKSASGRPNPFQ